MTMIEEALRKTTDTKACVIGPGATDAAAKMFGELFPDAKKAIVIDDPRTRAVAGERVIGLLKAAGRDVAEHVINPDGSDFHATYAKVEEMTPADIDDNAPLFGDEGLGLDSIDVLELIVLMEKNYGIKLSSPAEGKAVFQSVAVMADYVSKNRKK